MKCLKSLKYMTIPCIVLIVIVNFTDIKAHAVSEEIPVPIDIQILTWEACSFKDIDICMILSLIYEESRGLLPNLTQVTNLDWFGEGIESTQVTDPKNNQYENIRLCVYYINKWAEEYPGEPYLWMMMWNEGQDTALTHKDNPSGYAKRIITRADEWSELWDKGEVLRRP